MLNYNAYSVITIGLPKCRPGSPT